MRTWISKIRIVLQSINTHSPKFVALVIILVLIPLTILLSVGTQKNIHQKVQWKSYKEQVKNGEIEPAGKILEVGIHYTASASASSQFAVSSLKKKNGYVPKVLSGSNSYKIQLVDKNKNVLYNQTFDIPVRRIYEKLGSRNKVHGEEATASNLDFVLTLKWIDNATDIIISDKNNKQVILSKIVNVEVVDNVPKFKSINGQELTISLEKMFGFKFIPSVYAQSSDNILDIVYISAGYEDFGQFRRDVERFTNTLLSFDPLNARGSQIAIHIVENTTDLRCGPGGNTFDNRDLVCDNVRVVEEINNSGAPHDIINVIINTPNWGGTGGYISVMSNVENAEYAGVHEFGHTFGRLTDEYAYEKDGIGNKQYDYEVHNLDNTSDGNCYAGNPPASQWNGFGLSGGDYRSGCGGIRGALNWKAPSQTSIMRTSASDSRFFNNVSIAMINRRFDGFFGQRDYSDPHANPLDNQIPRGVVDEISCGKVVGWTFDSNDPSKSIAVHVYVNGAVGTPNAEGIDLGSTSHERPDVNDAYGISGIHGFELVLPEKYKDGSPHDVFVYAIDSTGGTNPEIGHGNTGACNPKNDNKSVNDPKGVVDQNDGQLIRGWSFDPDDSSASSEVHIYIYGSGKDAVGYNTGPTSVDRPDVNTAYGIAGVHGFSFSVPPEWCDGKKYTADVYGINIGKGGNALIGANKWSCGSKNPIKDDSRHSPNRDVPIGGSYPTNPPNPVPTFVCAGSRDSICTPTSTVVPQPTHGTYPIITGSPHVTEEPVVTPPVDHAPQDDCLDARKSGPERIREWVGGLIKKVNDYIQGLLGNPNKNPSIPRPCVNP